MIKKFIVVTVSFIIALVIVFIGISIYSYYRNVVSTRISDRDYIPDEETAIRIALAVWDAHFPNDSHTELPVRAIRRSNYWEVEVDATGWYGVFPRVHIRASDGRILFLAKV